MRKELPTPVVKRYKKKSRLCLATGDFGHW
jgi:hypothetical protein